MVGDLVTIRTDRAAADARAACSTWADERALALEHLEVRRPDLEDIFLELMGEGAADA